MTHIFFMVNFTVKFHREHTERGHRMRQVREKGKTGVLGHGLDLEVESLLTSLQFSEKSLRMYTNTLCCQKLRVTDLYFCSG